MNNLHITFRILLAIGGLAVAACYFLPLWQIKLWAPQYPEGLSIQIWHNNLKGDVDVINGLNHYIGMKLLKPEMFPEFAILKYIIAAFIVYTLLTAWKGNMKWLKIYCVVISISGMVALADFYRWGYDYGHNLDPHAPIQVPGMAYQPPVIGYKVLLNFTALSMPDTGGWIIVATGVLAYIGLFAGLMKQRKQKHTGILSIAILFIAVLHSCSNTTPHINFGTANCDFCKMTIMDNRFGAAIVTDKGRTYTFDDQNCRERFIDENKPQIKAWFAVVFDKPGTLIDGTVASYKRSESIKSPMGSGTAAFSSKEACQAYQTGDAAVCLTHTELVQ